MNVIMSPVALAVHVAIAGTIAVALPCRAASAQQNDATPTSADSTAREAPTLNQGTTRDTGNKEQKPEGSRRTDHVRFGVLGGVGFPRPLAIEGFVKIEKLLGVGVEYSVLPTLDISGVETSFYAVAADARVFPFKNAFFVGLRGGRQHLGGNSNITISGYGVVRESASVDTTFVNPRLGFLWTWEPGITLGIDAGVQIPVSSSTTSSIPQSAIPASVTIDDDIKRVTNTLGKNVLPTVDLLKVGFLL